MAELLSMTGYGSASGTAAQELTVELRSVNNRYLDCTVRLPRQLLFAEDVIKQTVASLVRRGKVDVYVNASGSSADTMVAVNTDLARGYYEAVQELSALLGVESGLSALSVARFPDVLSVEKREVDKDETLAALQSITAAAVEEFNAMREREGARLKEDMLEKAARIEELVAQVEERSPRRVEEYRARLEGRLRELLADHSVDEQRILTEVAVFADRTAVDEETVRLHSHLAQFRQLLEEGSPVGRKLDFLIQEFNREANTIGSKCNDTELSQLVVEIKSEIEKIREQVQNIE